MEVERLVASAKEARESRALERRRAAVAVVIQAGARGFLSRRRTAAQLRAALDAAVGPAFDDADTYKAAPLPPALHAYTALRRFLFCFDADKDRGRFFRVARYLLASIEAKDVGRNVVSVALSKEEMARWVETLKRVLWEAARYLEGTRMESLAQMKELNVGLHLLVSLTATSNWALLKLPACEPLRPSLNALCANVTAHLLQRGLLRKLGLVLRKGLCRTKPCLRNVSLAALVSLAIRPLVNAGWPEPALGDFLAEILSVPALLHHLEEQAPECLALLMSQAVFQKSLDAVASEGVSRKLFSATDGLGALGLLANLVHLASLQLDLLASRLLDFTNVLTRIVHKCGAYVVSQKSQTSHWHPVLGWFAQPLDPGTQAAMPLLVKQLQRLWSSDVSQRLFAHLQPLQPPSADDFPAQTSSESALSSQVKGLLRLKRSSSAAKPPSLDKVSMGSEATTTIGLVCLLYDACLSTFTQLRYHILSGLAHRNFLLPRLWMVLEGLGGKSSSPAKAFLHLLAANPAATAPEFQILRLFCQLGTYLITILDDMELYEQATPLPLPQLAAVAAFLNQLYVKAVWGHLVPLGEAESNSLLKSVHGLLALLAQRHARRPLSPDPDLWLLRDLKGSLILAELDKAPVASAAPSRAQLLLHKVPHIIPHRDRVLLFRKLVNAERESVAGTGPSHLVTINRPRLVEDAYRQMSLLSTASIKATVRIRFVNDQGLDEAGIDQDGVFKEFLELVLARLTDPVLSLFKATSENALYPSAASDVHDNHLALLDFAGRMLGKAVYEGLLVDVVLAPFFLSQVLGRSSGLGYSAFDQLPSLDPELYKSLTYIKHYDGDVSDLGLFLCWDEEVMGVIRSHDLIPGGSTIPLTNGNRISYIHHMAHFRMHKQIKDQVTAFAKGFRSIISPQWSALFAVDEFQRLVSGESEKLELSSLRKHTQYYGGFHNSHRLINWLWELLDKDFSPGERKLFLRFVTSRSKPPLLGWAHLEPPFRVMGFSIRCVEVGEEEDTGDTLGSVLRGFLAIRLPAALSSNGPVGKPQPQARLPTSSTCFNLLKLPNYHRKSTLRDKLRYAIHSNTGFELS